MAKHFNHVPLASLDDIVFGGWDVFPDSAHEAAKKAGVLSERDLERIKDFMDAIKPWPAIPIGCSIT